MKHFRKPPLIAIAAALGALVASCSDQATTTPATDAALDRPDISTVDGGDDVAPDGAPRACTANADCMGSSTGPVCNTTTGLCVRCLPSGEGCGMNEYCDTATLTCMAGCRDDMGCPMGQSCQGNRCVSRCGAGGACAMGQQCCDGACVDTQANPSHCGMCGNACSTANAAPTCAAGMCTVGRCAEGFADCDGSATNGCEVDTRASGEHCGGCGRACPAAPNATASCRMGACAITCAMGFGDCDGNAMNGCEADTRTTTANCGMCGNACPTPANGAAACVDGRCGVGTCSANFGDCDGMAANGCETDTRSSPAHCGRCGNVCPVGQTCNDGRCEVQCTGATTRCGSECVATGNDPDNCGRCGNVCPRGQLCGMGACVPTCGMGQVNCSGSCSNLQTDPENCGRCGNTCMTGYACRNGACELACATGQTICGGACVDQRVSNQHCGRCDAPCAMGYRCTAGACVISCPAGQTACGGECAELSRDPNHCGACGRTCPTGCFQGDCARVDTVEAGTNFTCARYTSGRVFCWGYNLSSFSTAAGMLSTAGGAWGHRPGPVIIVDGNGRSIEEIAQIATGNQRACARGTDGNVRCWGLNIPLNPVLGMPPVTQISGRENNFCGLSRTGQVYCWDGAPRTATVAALTPVAGLSGVVEIAAGGTFTCARLMDNTVQCWGTGTSGQLGQGANTNSATPVAVRGLTDATALTAGQNHACARRADGSVVCWGLNSDGQLGDNSTTNRNTATAVMGLTGVASVRAGLRHTCAVLTDGGVRCWGDDSLGQLGDPGLVDHITPQPVPGLGPARHVTAYNAHTCVVLRDNTVRCWGTNAYGEAGGGTELLATPTAVQGLSDVVDLQVGASYNYALMASTSWRCALRTDGKVSCWGSAIAGNEAGQLGDGTTTQRPLPTLVAGLEDATQIAVGWLHACALRRDRTVVCWGSNTFGQVGDGTNTNRSSFRTVMGIANAVEIRSGDYHTCARLMDGTVRCWGYNFYGELGDGGMVNSNVPRAVMGLTGAVQLQAGANYTCARVMDGRVLCWGRNIEAQLGDGFRTNRALPGPVTTATSTAAMPVAQTGFTDISCDYVRCRGTIAMAPVGWGWNWSDRVRPRPELANVVQNARSWVSDLVDNECEIRTDMMTYCRGRNEYGHIGNGTTDLRVTTFTPVTGSFSQIRLARGYTAPCAVERGTGRVLCWGWTGNGALLAAGSDGITRTPALVPMP